MGTRLQLEDKIRQPEAYTPAAWDFTLSLTIRNLTDEELISMARSCVVGLSVRLSRANNSSREIRYHVMRRVLELMSESIDLEEKEEQNRGNKPNQQQ